MLCEVNGDKAYRCKIYNVESEDEKILRKPINLYDGDSKITGWHNNTKTGTGRIEFSDTYDDVVSGKIYAGEIQLIPPDCKYAEYSGIGALSVENTVENPIKGVRVFGNAVNPKVNVVGKNLISADELYSTTKQNGCNNINLLENNSVEIWTFGSMETKARLVLGFKPNTAYTFYCDVEWDDETDERVSQGVFLTYKDSESSVTNVASRIGINKTRHILSTDPTRTVLAIEFGGWQYSGRCKLLNMRLYEGVYTAENIPAYEPYTSNAITLPYTLQSVEDQKDSVDTFLSQYIRRIGDDGTPLAEPIAEDIGENPLVSYAGSTTISVTDDNGADVSFSAIVATDEIPEVQSPLNPFRLVTTKNPTVTSSGRNLIDKSMISSDDGNYISQTETGIRINNFYACSSNLYADEIFEPNTTYYVHSDKSVQGTYTNSTGQISVSGSFIILGAGVASDRTIQTPPTIPHKQVIFYGKKDGYLEFNNFYIGKVPYVKYEPFRGIEAKNYPVELYQITGDDGVAVKDELQPNGIVRRNCGKATCFLPYGVYEHSDWKNLSVCPIHCRIIEYSDTKRNPKRYNLVSNLFNYIKEKIIDVEKITTNDGTGDRTFTVFFTAFNSTMMVKYTDSASFKVQQAKRLLEKLPEMELYFMEVHPYDEEPMSSTMPRSFYASTVTEAVDENGKPLDMEITLKEHD